MPSSAPAAATPRVMASALGTFYLAGGVAGLAIGVGGASVGVTPQDHAMIALGGSAVVSALALFRWGRRLPRQAFHAVVGLATVLIFIAITFCANDALSAVAMTSVYYFVIVDCVFFFSLRAGLYQATATLVAAGWGLQEYEVPWGVRIALLAVGWAIAVVVGRLVRMASQGSADALTGLRNRRGFDEHLEHLVSAARVSRVPLSLVVLDLDHFKAVNDTGGHAAGDELLRAFGRHLQDHLGLARLAEDGVAARLGGDEFALLLPGMSVQAAHDLVERRRPGAPCGYSVGVADLGAGETPTEFLRRADAALYLAKAGGRGRSAICSHRDTATRTLAEGIR